MTEINYIDFEGFLAANFRLWCTVMFSIGCLTLNYENERVPFPHKSRLHFEIIKPNKNKYLHENVFLYVHTYENILTVVLFLDENNINNR